MSVTSRSGPAIEVSVHLPSTGLTLDAYAEGNSLVVRAAGELDLASRDQLFAAAIAGSDPAMVIDLAAVTFMDCSGYGSLAASRLVVEQSGRSLTIRGQTGQPARLFDLIQAQLGGTTEPPRPLAASTAAHP